MSPEKIFRFLGAVRSVTNVKQANVKMLLSALALFYEYYQTCFLFLSDRLNLT